jgi:hypothetical protein
MYTLLLNEAYYYYDDDYTYAPKLIDVSPHAASSEEPITIKGANLGYWIQDYRMVYVGSGRAPQGGNINNGQTATETGTTHAVCRPGELNSGKNPTEPDIKLPGGADVMPEDRDPDPISEDQIVCALGDFMAGSYNVSVYMSNAQRGGNNLNSATLIPGLAVVDDYNGYFDASLFSRDANGVVHMVQYYPRIDSVSPVAGSVAGGTKVTIEGGGFAMSEDDVMVTIAGRQCVVTYASIELIVCNTTKESAAVVKSKVSIDDHAAEAANVPYSWMMEAQTAGTWTTVTSSSAHGGSYLSSTGSSGGSAAAPSSWVTFVPDPTTVAASTSGLYELLLRLPSMDECLPRADNVSVVIRSGRGYSLQVVDLRPAQTSEADDGDPTETDDGDQGEFEPDNGGSVVSLGNHVLLEGATTLVTVDTLGAGADACVAVDNVLLRFVSAISSGCTDSTAENYDADVTTDDGSCLYLGGRGLSTRSWSAMSGPFKTDDW